jgi:uncharacterized membrane protein YhhN
MKAAVWLMPLLAATVLLLVRAGILGKQRQIYLLKPLSTLLVIAVAALALVRPERDLFYTVGVLLGLALSLAGDVALMFEQNRRAFAAGLGCFLLAHVAYTVVFGALGSVSWLDAVSAVALLAAGVGTYMLVKENLGSLRLPVIAYILVISVMVNRAISTLSSPVLSAQQGRMAAAGAVLFYISDFMLAACLFWKPWRYRRVSLLFYYGGQTLIALAGSYFG